MKARTSDLKGCDMKFVLDTNTLSQDQIRQMKLAGEVVRDAYRWMKKSDTNIVAQVLEGQGAFYQFDHYPEGDVYDRDSHAQYYYHAHREESGEHGHFHTFLRVKGFPQGIKEAPYSGKAKRPLGEDALSHLIAISMNSDGFPMALFTTNRWVTDETYYTAQDVMKMLPHFEIDHVSPCLGVNKWITAILVLFQPQIEALLHERDKKISAWQASHLGVDVYEDRDLEITSILDIDVEQQIAQLEQVVS